MREQRDKWVTRCGLGSLGDVTARGMFQARARAGGRCTRGTGRSCVRGGWGEGLFLPCASPAPHARRRHSRRHSRDAAVARGLQMLSLTCRDHSSPSGPDMARHFPTPLRASTVPKTPPKRASSLPAPCMCALSVGDRRDHRRRRHETRRIAGHSNHHRPRPFVFESASAKPT